MDVVRKRKERKSDGLGLEVEMRCCLRRNRSCPSLNGSGRRRMRRGTSRRERDGECLGGKRGTSKVKRREMDCGGCLGEARERWPLRRGQRESRLVKQVRFKHTQGSVSV